MEKIRIQIRIWWYFAYSVPDPDTKKLKTSKSLNIFLKQLNFLKESYKT